MIGGGKKSGKGTHLAHVGQRLDGEYQTCAVGWGT